MRGGGPLSSLSGDNGGRGLGLSEARVSGNVSVLRAPGAGVKLCSVGGRALMQGAVGEEPGQQVQGLC